MHLAKDPLRRGPQQLARRREKHAFSHAVEKRHPDILLQGLDRVADRGLRQVKILGGLGKAPAPRQGGEGEQLAAV
jgi:hypothetical protein